LEEAGIQIKKFRPTLIIADWRLPDGDSSALLAQNHYSPAPPVIIMTSYGSERNAVEAIKAVALDYIIKSSEAMTDRPHLAERAIQQWKGLLDQARMYQELADRESTFRPLAAHSSAIISRPHNDGPFP